ncbi:MAG: cation:dicarboxylate symporter family transporter [Culicoidibacterales bacterium]
MINIPFFTKFLQISNVGTFAAIISLLIMLLFVHFLKKKKVSFSNRMLIALFLGLILGVGIDLVFPQLYTDPNFYYWTASKEIASWYSLLGTGFLRLVQLLAIPVVFLSIIKVITEVQGENLKGLTWKTFTLLLSTTAIAAVIGIFVVKLFALDSGNFNFADQLSPDKLKAIQAISAQSFSQFFLSLVPNNIMSTFADNGKIVSVVIIAAIMASAIRFLKVKKADQVAPFISFLASTSTVVNSMLSNILKFMPYGVIALVSNTIIQNGMTEIVKLFSFIVAIYVGVLMMLIVHAIILMFSGLNPITYFKKASGTLLFAFSSRSSVGTLPYTLKTLNNDLGVSGETANFVGSLGTTIGMNGCAGVFPAMLAIIVASIAGLPVDFGFLALVVVVVTIGSIGIAGVPGTATVAATVTLNGLGLGNYMEKIGGIFGIDPIIDMGRTMLNVSGSMVSALVVDRWEGHHDMTKYSDQGKKEKTNK